MEFDLDLAWITKIQRPESLVHLFTNV
jgi:hypothetical protein